MKRLVLGIAMVVLPISAQAISAPSDPVSLLHRDETYEQHIRLMASPDSAVTPARVLRWLSSLAGNTSNHKPSNLEFQPIVRVHESQEQIIAQLNYKF